MSTLVADLKQPGVELIETHISWVFRHADRVYKVKKPVDFGFLDFSTPGLRLAACQAEVEVNRRLAPGVYLGVVPVTRDGQGRHALRGEGEVVDHAVEMVRLDDADRADLRLAEDRLGEAELDRLARTLADFHAACREDAETRAFGDPQVIGANVRENLAQSQPTIGQVLSEDEAARIGRAQLHFLDEGGDLFRQRSEAGRIRDGHGDLRLEHVYLADDGPLRVIDAIEFNERFRFADVAADVAFLSMDLEAHGRVDLAELFLARYARYAQDYDLYAVIDFYEGYRAWVRAKIAAFALAEPELRGAARQAVVAKARHYYLLSLATQRRPALPPVLVAVGGVLATGKSTVADRLTAMLGAPVISTDRTRKHLLGLKATDKVYSGGWQGAYSLDFTDIVYQELFRRAGVVLRSGRPVVLDASFRSEAVRTAARSVAAAEGVPFLFVECACDHDLCRQRLARRAQGESVSDGRLEIFDTFVENYEPVEEIPPEQWVVLDTARPLEKCMQVLERRLPLWERAA